MGVGGAIWVVDGDTRRSRQIVELAGLAHSTMAELVRVATEFDEGGGWNALGIRSCAHWLTINTGFDVWTASEILRVGQALRELPKIAEAFATGQLSFDKARAVTAVAAPAEDELWLEVALHASGSQLSRICRAYRRVIDTDDPERARAHLARRKLSAWWRSDGMLELTATLPPEDGALVMAAIEAALPPRPTPEAEAAVPDPAEDLLAARRADALVSVCERTLAGAGGEGQPRQMVVHVDIGVLTGDQPGGRCHIEGGPALSAALARRLGCDTDLVAITERDGAPIDVGRGRRVVSRRLGRALQARDATCRFPGCGVPAQRTEAHHVTHWVDGGRTDMSNLLSLCGFHHKRLHEGAFRIRVVDREARFEAPDGTALVRVSSAAPVATIREIIPETPRALEGGAPCNLAYVVDTLLWATIASRAGP